eukprot:Hpha_TRINITY_DN15583_c3_g11::TRINITY_DN15583_c3_g11_i1::g.104025::m.104025
MPSARTMPQWEWQDDGTTWTPFHTTDSGVIEKAYLTCGTKKPFLTKDLTWNRQFGTQYKYDFSLMRQQNMDSKRVRYLRRTEVQCCRRGHAMTKRDGATIKCTSCSKSSSGISFSCGPCKEIRCARCAGAETQLKTFSTPQEFLMCFRQLSATQTETLRADTATSAMLKRDDLSVVWTSHSDVGRTFKEATGQNTTDINFFAVAPSSSRGDDDRQLVPFPAVRAPNYADPVDILPNAGALKFQARSLTGELRDVDLTQFLARIGEFIGGLGNDANWADAIDDTPMQQSTQFSVIPTPSGATEVGVGATGNRCTNLHVIIGPGGEVGWAPEKPGMQKIYFRDGNGAELRAIRLVPEDRKEVAQAFFKVEVRDESVEEERERYKNAENRLLHLQIAMDGVPELAVAVEGPRSALNACPMGHKLTAAKVTVGGGFICDICDRQLTPGCTHFGCRPCDFDVCPQCRDASGAQGGSPGWGVPAPAHLDTFGSESFDDMVLKADDLAAEAKQFSKSAKKQKSSLFGGFGSSGGFGGFGACPAGFGGFGASSPSPSSVTPSGMFGGFFGGSAPPAAAHVPFPADELCALSDFRGGAPPPAMAFTFGGPAPAAPAAPAAQPSGDALSGGGAFYFGGAGATPAGGGGFCLGGPPRPAPASTRRLAKRPSGAAQQQQQQQRTSSLFSLPTATKKSAVAMEEGCRDTSSRWHPSEKEKKEKRNSKPVKHDGLQAKLATRSRDRDRRQEREEELQCFIDEVLCTSDDDGDEILDMDESCEEEQPATTEAGLQLARVSMGECVGRAGPEYNAPEGAKRKAGVAVRATWLHYGVAADGKIDAERVRRFAKQIAFRRRELGLAHGSLVTGLGTWGGPENCPIKLFGFRLTDATDAVQGANLGLIRGVSQIATPTSITDACKPLNKVVPGVSSAAKAAASAAKALHKMCKGKLKGTPDHIAALYLYTMETAFYRSLNAAMRNPDRSNAQPYFGYLRLLFEALENVMVATRPKTLFRGVGLDLSKEHSVGTEVYWWGASSCTPKKSVAQGFLGCSGNRTMFTVKPLSAVPIKEFSAFRGEEEWLLRPGTRLRVEGMTKLKGGMTEVTLCELPPPRGVE